MTYDISEKIEKAKLRPVALAKPAVAVTRLADGSMLLMSKDPLLDYDRQVGVWLRRWAKQRPDQVYLAERDGSGGWRTITYAEAKVACDAISQFLLDRRLDHTNPVMILSENSINFALLAIAAMQVGIPVSPISPSYSLVSRDFSKLIPISKLLNPGMIFAEDGVKFEGALKVLDTSNADIVVAKNPVLGLETILFSELLSVAPGPDVDKAFAAVTPDHIAKYMFTSGSTGTPKGVINTHRMLCANQQMTSQTLQFLSDEPPIIVDWLPWNHTAAGNFIFNTLLCNGGSYYIDTGKPVPGLFDQTLENLRDISPTLYFNVPAGFAALLPYLEREKVFREKFFKNIKFIWYAGAALTQDLWDRIEHVAFKATGERIAMTSGFGTTESAPSLTFSHWHGSQLGNVGAPMPGCEIKLAPMGDKLEIRAKGPSMSPGYLGDPELSASSLDEDGFFKFGDAMRLLDPDDPSKGLIFDGRLSENFKLATSTWVNVGLLRTDVVAACAPALQDLVACGHNKDFLGILAWPSLSGCQEISGLGANADMTTLIKDPKVRAHIAERLSNFNATAGGSSRVIKRVILLAEPPQIDADEITDKGYINQRAALAHRANLIGGLLSDKPPRTVIKIG